MNTAWKSIVLGIVLLLAFLYYRHSQRPDVQLGHRLGAICSIADKGAAAPQMGVDALFGYFAANTPELMRDFGGVLVELGKIDGEAEHDERARESARRIWGPLLACGGKLERFGDAIDGDPVASRKLEAGVERVGRSLTLLFGGEPERLMPKSVRRVLRLHAK